MQKELKLPFRVRAELKLDRQETKDLVSSRCYYCSLMSKIYLFDVNEEINFTKFLKKLFQKDSMTKFQFALMILHIMRQNNELNKS